MNDPEPPNPYTSAPYNPYAAPMADSPPPQGAVFEASIVPASVLSRIGAHMIDITVVAGMCFALLVIYGIVVAASGHQPDEQVTSVLPVAMLVPGIAFETIFQAATGQSLGKRLLGIRVVDMDGRPAGFARVFFLRNVIPFAIQMICGIFTIVDLISIFVNDHRTLHDGMSGTRVVRVTR